MDWENIYYYLLLATNITTNNSRSNGLNKMIAYRN